MYKYKYIFCPPTLEVKIIFLESIYIFYINKLLMKY